MKYRKGNIYTSATDLANHLSCRHLTKLEHEAARGRLKRPHETTHRTELLQKRGNEHEDAYKAHLVEQGLTVVELSRDDNQQAAFDAMRVGADVILQARLGEGMWGGYSDFLIKRPGASNFGDYHYDVTDTKLANTTKGGTILQLCLYTEILGDLQGRMPEYMYVVSPGNDFTPEQFRYDDFRAYHALIKRRLEDEVATGVTSPTYPYPCSHCDVCRWWRVCEKQRKDDDHLSLVAGIHRGQMKDLESNGIGSLTSLARLQLPYEPASGSPESYERVHHQARVQLQGREEDRCVHEVLDFETGYGLTRLPEPSPGDVFFDIEGDRFVGMDGLEYLFGWITVDSGEEVYDELWAFDDREEKRMFEQFMDTMMARLEKYPEMHIYHYNHYEPTQLKRLMGKYATRADELDHLLKHQIFVDLYPIVKQSVRASVESYSIKKLEPFYEYVRQVDLEDEARENLKLIETALEFEATDAITDTIKTAVAGYNEDDCISTRRLRDWLEDVRSTEIANGRPIERPGPPEVKEREDLKEKDRRIRAACAALLDQVPEDREDRSDAQQAVWILAHSLEWFRREEKVTWWEYHRLRVLSQDDMYDERAALADLTFVQDVSEGRRTIHRYRYPEQETKLKEGDTLKDTNEKTVGSVAWTDPIERLIDISKSRNAPDNVVDVFAHDSFGVSPMQESLLALGVWLIENNLDSEDAFFRAARNLLLRVPPVAISDSGNEGDDEIIERIWAIVSKLDRETIAVQGPPGSGKTYSAAHVICRLVQSGKKVGITANSHKVIRNLIDKVLEIATETGVTVSCLQKPKKVDKDRDDRLHQVTDSKKVSPALHTGQYDVVAGTSWLFSREDMADAVDVLIVDEAGQMSLPKVLALSRGGKNLVLIGDPQQLEQPVKGSHPDGVDISAMDYLLNGHETIPDELGIFMKETWRLHPEVCGFISDTFYEGKLRPEKDNHRQDLQGHETITGPGVWLLPVEHEGRRNASMEEAEEIARMVGSLTSGSVTWTDRMGKTSPVTIDDILFIAPYNSQVTMLKTVLGGTAKVGTVDKFQGQEAPIVFYSLSTSSPEDAPRGLNFLYNLNRLNVAISRAKVACVVVCNPALFEPDCKTPRQMQLANGLCRLREVAREVGG